MGEENHAPILIGGQHAGGPIQDASTITIELEGDGDEIQSIDAEEIKEAVVVRVIVPAIVRFGRTMRDAEVFVVVSGGPVNVSVRLLIVIAHGASVGNAVGQLGA